MFIFSKKSLALAVLLSLSLVVALADPPISLRLTPSFGYAPLAVQLSIRVVPHADNRVVCIDINSSNGYYRRSCFEHIGAKGPGLIVQSYTNLDAGTYDVIASVIRVDKSVYSASATFQALGY